MLLNYFRDNACYIVAETHLLSIVRDRLVIVRNSKICDQRRISFTKVTFSS